MTAEKDMLAIGRAAEYLVCADLLLAGFNCFPTDQGLAYDLILEATGRLWRIQVKACLGTRNVNAKGINPRLAYSWNIRRRGKDGKGHRLSREHCDIIALVALDCRAIAYIPVDSHKATIQLSPPSSAVKAINGRIGHRAVDSYPIQDVLAGTAHVFSVKPSTHCPHGHEYTPENTLRTSRQRVCRACAALGARKKRAAKNV